MARLGPVEGYFCEFCNVLEVKRGMSRALEREEWSPGSDYRKENSSALTMELIIVKKPHSLHCRY